MGIEEKVKTLEDEFRVTAEELKHIILDMRVYIMEAETPIPNDLEREKLLTESDRLRKIAASERGAGRDDDRQNRQEKPRLGKKDSGGLKVSERGVERDGDR